MANATTQNRRGLSAFSIGIGAAVLAFAGAAGWWAAAAMRGVEQPAESLYVAPRYLQIGDVWETPAFKWEVPIENHADKDVRIDGFLPSCNCMSIEPKSITIPARGTARVTLTISLMLTGRKDADLDSKAFEVSFSPHVPTGPPQGAGWTVSGRVRRVLRLQPREVYFETRLVKGQPFEAQSVVAHVTEPLRELTARCDPSLGTVQVQRHGGHDDEFQVSVKPSAALPAGSFRFDVVLEAVSQTKGKLPSVTLPVEGKVLEDVQAVPEFLLFGAQPVGTTITQTVLLRSARQKRFAAVVSGPVPDGLTVEPGEESANDGDKAFRISRRITKAGKQESDIVFTVRPEQGARSTVTLKVTYIGLPSKGGQPPLNEEVER